MFIRKRLTYANIVATLAPVFAMSGGALAASHYLITSTKQISPKVLKKLHGKAGKTGTAGPAGPAGPAGKEGSPGKEGKEWAPGLSALSTLLAGQSESGQVGVVANNATSGHDIESTVTFPVPLPEALTEAHVIFTTKSGTTHCSGPGHAEAGYLCIYVVFENAVETPTALNLANTEPGAGPTGFGAFWSVTASGEAWAEGSYTVTAP